MENQKFANRLIHESSPYLLQHAHNPVDWHPWSEETLEKAKSLDRMILVSIGYSACHWCHVMERESFEDELVAGIMNANFICIKVDREERPDVDQVYMDAVQLISGRGGWPLNCFAMPDGRPVWGGTYFRKEQWKEILENMALLYSADRAKLEEQAEALYSGIRDNPFIHPRRMDQASYEKGLSGVMASSLLRRIDHELGGFRGSPKFPMPNNFHFLLRYHFYTGDPEARNAVDHTLQKMAQGGIYDQIGGGFARYSVDDRWHVPHFEKMLYDNAQLTSLYSEAFTINRHALYEEVIRQTLSFVDRELTSPQGGFYAALDADSEGVEGKYYVWQQEEFNDVLGSEAPLLSDYFGIGGDAYWEDGNNVLTRRLTIEDLARKHGIPPKLAKEKISLGCEKLLEAREKRVHPGLDNKILTSWNSLMLKAYVDAYRALGEKTYLDAALRNAAFIEQQLIVKDGHVMRSFKSGPSAIEGFLDDYAFLMEAFISLYEVTFDEKWIIHAEKLANYTIQHFHDPESGLFWYTSDRHHDSVARKMDVTDNVIPSSLSSLARALHALGLLLERPSFTSIAEGMLAGVKDSLQRFPSAFTNWGILYLQLAYPFHTVVIAGPEALRHRDDMLTLHRPDVLYAGGNRPSDMGLMKNRWDADKTRLFICTGTMCHEPVESNEEALRMLNSLADPGNS